MSLKATSDLWWKNAVIYCLDLETFFDSDGDGSGDLGGLTERLDYLAGIGISCVWLMPFYASPRKDDGYDISDFYAVDPRLGTHGDFSELIRTARDRGIRVIADLVVNHTSDQHPWFKAARTDRGSAYRDFYVWSDDKPEEKLGDVVFPDRENSNWAWDDKAGQYYLHRFYSHQPDLNVANPAVRDEIAQVMGFWIEQGLSGFPDRRRAIPARADGHAGGVDGRSARADARPAALRYAAPRRGHARSARSTSSRPKPASSSATRTATSCTCCSTSSGCRPCTWRSRAAPRRPWARRCATRLRSRRTASGGAS